MYYNVLGFSSLVLWSLWKAAVVSSQMTGKQQYKVDLWREEVSEGKSLLLFRGTAVRPENVRMNREERSQFHGLYLSDLQSSSLKAGWELSCHMRNFSLLEKKLDWMTDDRLLVKASQHLEVQTKHWSWVPRNKKGTRVFLHPCHAPETQTVV